MSSLTEIIRENFDLRPAGIIKMLDLRRPIYHQTAAYGHFGRHDLDLPWEKLDKVDDSEKISVRKMLSVSPEKADSGAKIKIPPRTNQSSRRLFFIQLPY